MLWNNLVSRMVDGGALQSGDGNNGGGPGDGAITLFTRRHFSMHVGQIDRGTDNAVRQSVVLPHSLTVDLTRVNSAFNSAGSVPVSAYALNAEAEPDFDLSDAQNYVPGLYSLAVPNVGHYMVRRKFDPDTAAGNNVGGMVIRNEAGHIIHNLSTKGGPPITKRVLHSLQNYGENQSGHWDSRPFILQNGPFAGKLVSPVITSSNEPGRSNQQINIVDPYDAFGYNTTSDTRLAAIYGSWLNNTDRYKLSSGCVVEHATDGSLIVLTPSNAYDGFNLHKVTPQPLNPALPDTAPDVSLNVPFSFYTSINTARFRFRMLRLANGNYFITWQNGKDEHGVEYGGTNPCTVHYCIVAGDLSSIIVAPTALDVDGSGTFAQWNAEPCLNAAGNVVVAWMSIDGPQAGSYAPNLSLVAKVFSPAGAAIVAKTTIRDYFDTYDNPSIYYPISQYSEVFGAHLVGSRVLIVSNIDHNQYPPNTYGVYVDAVDGATLSIAGELFAAEENLLNPSRYATNQVSRAASFLSVTTHDDLLYIGGATRNGDKYGFAVIAINNDCDVVASSTVNGMGQTDSLNNKPFWLTANNSTGQLRIDVLDQNSSNVERQVVDFMRIDNLEQVVDYAYAYDNDLFVLLPGRYLLDTQLEWDNVTFQLAKISSSQAVLAKDFYDKSETGLVSKGTVEQATKHRFFVEFDSDSFIVGSGYYSADGSGPAPSGTLCRLAIDLVRNVDGVPVTIRNVGYIDLNTDGSYTKPEFITRLDLLDNDVIQLRQVNFVGNLLNEFRVAEATATLVGTGEIELWT